MITLTLPPGLPVGAHVEMRNTGNENWVVTGDAASTVRFVKEVIVFSADLDHDAYKLPVQELVSLWITRYGNEWIDVDKVESDPFYKHVHHRLRSLGELEQHYLTDRNKYVCRRPE